MYPGLFNQPPTEGHLSCFYSLRNVLLLQNSAAMNNLVHPSCWTFTSVLGQISLEVELGHGSIIDDRYCYVRAECANTVLFPVLFF